MTFWQVFFTVMAANIATLYGMPFVARRLADLIEHFTSGEPPEVPGEDS